jgi:hypothetical protein
MDVNKLADMKDAWWSGYYTVRPAQKQLSRWQDSSLRSAEMMYALRFLDNDSLLSNNISNSNISKRQLSGNQQMGMPGHVTMINSSSSLREDPYAIDDRLFFGRTSSALYTHHDAIAV